MEKDTLRTYVADLTHETPERREVARAALLAGDEAFIDALIDEFYAGVGIPTGEVLLDIIGQIGGYLAINTLQYVYEFEHHDSWKDIAEKWLKHDGFL